MYAHISNKWGGMISVIIPVYNQEDLVLRALKSIPLNTDGIEIILINDGSTDNSLEIMATWMQAHDYLCPIKLISSRHNCGIAHAMNVGFDEARGEYIISLSSDDYFLTDFSEFMPYLDGKNDLVYFDLEVNDGSIWHLDEDSKNEFVGAVKFIRREFLGDTRIPDMKWHEDKQFSEELYAKNPREVFTGIVLKHYNFPREGSLIWQADHEGDQNGV